MDEQTPEQTPARRHDRRALLLGAAIAGAGVTADLVAGAAPAQAANGNPVELGKTNKATDPTVVSISSAGSALTGQTATTSGTGVTGVDTSTDGGTGVYGSSIMGTGVIGSSTDFTGVAGTTTADNQAGVSGVDGSTGGGYGVSGGSPYGIGVYGLTTGGGNGVYGYAYGNSGNGVSAECTDDSGYGLRVIGRVQFGDICAQQATIAGTSASPKISGTVTGLGPDVLNAATVILATAQAHVAGVAVAAAVPDVTAGSVTVYLTKAVKVSVPVILFLFDVAEVGGGPDRKPPAWLRRLLHRQRRA